MNNGVFLVVALFALFSPSFLFGRESTTTQVNMRVSDFYLKQRFLTSTEDLSFPPFNEFYHRKSVLFALYLEYVQNELGFEVVYEDPRKSVIETGEKLDQPINNEVICFVVAALNGYDPFLWRITKLVPLYIDATDDAVGTRERVIQLFVKNGVPQEILKLERILEGSLDNP